MSNEGLLRERLVAAAYAQSGYFIERNRKLEGGCAEIDVVALRLAPTVDRVLVGVTRSTTRSPKDDAHGVATQRRFLGLDRGVAITRKPLHEAYESRLARDGTRALAIDDDDDVVDRLVASGECPGATPEWTRILVGALEVVDTMRQTVSAMAAPDAPVRELGIEVKRRMQEGESDLWIREDQLVRARRLRTLDLSNNRNVTTRVAALLYPIGEYRHRAFNAFRDPRALPVHSTLYVQLAERLLIVRTLVELAMAAADDPRLRADLGRDYLVGHRVLAALDRLDVARFVPTVLQTFYLVLGGFTWAMTRDAEYEFLGRIAGCSGEVARIALDDVFPRLYPFGVRESEWRWRVTPLVEAHKFFPSPLHGAGVVARDLLHADNKKWAPSLTPPHWRQSFDFARGQLRRLHGDQPKRRQKAAAISPPLRGA